MEQPTQNKMTLPGAIIIAGALLAMAIIFKSSPARSVSDATPKPVVQAVLSDGGHILPLDAEKSMLETLQNDGVIDGSKLPEVTELNLLWAFGLAEKNRILDSGRISDVRYGGAMTMASVGGWTVSDGSPADHMSKHMYVKLTVDEQALVEKVSKGIYRPCCNNSTYFPDCNHGMAMLGLLEYLAAHGATEDEMWNAALAANMNWFPDEYQTIAEYMKENGIDGKNMRPEEILSTNYSSASGFADISAQVSQPAQKQGGGSCGVDSGVPPVQALPKKSGASCGV